MISLILIIILFLGLILFYLQVDLCIQIFEKKEFVNPLKSLFLLLVGIVYLILTISVGTKYFSLRKCREFEVNYTNLDHNITETREFIVKKDKPVLFLITDENDFDRYIFSVIELNDKAILKIIDYANGFIRNEQRFFPEIICKRGDILTFGNISCRVIDFSDNRIVLEVSKMHKKVIYYSGLNNIE